MSDRLDYLELLISTLKEHERRLSAVADKIEEVLGCKEE